MWGPIVYGPGPFTRRESKGPSRRGLWPKPNNVKHKIALRYRRGPLSPRQTQSPTGERGKNGIGLSLKENLKYLGKLPLLSLNALHLTEPHSLTFTTTPNDFEYGLMGQVSVLESLTLHVDEGQRTQASIKGKISNLEKGLGKMAKNQSLPAHLQEKDSRGEEHLTMHEHHERPTTW